MAGNLQSNKQPKLCRLNIKFFNTCMIKMVKERYKFIKHLFIFKTILINTGASEYVNYHALI